MNTTYFIWRRNDGYIGATAGWMPNGWRNPFCDVTFTKLGETTSWSETREIIERERAGAEAGAEA